MCGVALIYSQSLGGLLTTILKGLSDSKILSIYDENSFIFTVISTAGKCVLLSGGNLQSEHLLTVTAATDMLYSFRIPYP